MMDPMLAVDALLLYAILCLLFSNLQDKMAPMAKVHLHTEGSWCVSILKYNRSIPL